MIIFYVRNDTRKRARVTVLPGVGRVVAGQGEVWKIDRDEQNNIQVHVR